MKIQQGNIKLSQEKPQEEKYIRTTVSIPPWLMAQAKKEAGFKTGGFLSPFIVMALEEYFNKPAKNQKSTTL